MPHGFVSFAELKRAVSMEAILKRYELSEGLTRKGANLAGPCPFCKGTSGRQFQVNLVKNAWYCFGCKAGGNVLDFVAKRERVSVRTAALTLDSWFELGLVREERCAETPAIPTEEAVASVASPPPAKELPTKNPPLTFSLKTLDPNHASLATLGLGGETIARFGAGYCTKGLLKGRLAIPIHTCRGELLAYAGLAVEEGQAPRYLFPPNFQPALEVFNLHRLSEIPEETGPLHITPEIDGVLRLSRAGIDSALGLFDGSLSPEQEEALTGALSLYEGLLLVGEGFPDRTVARLARYAAVSWMAELPESPFASV
ncbi:MAG TPA: CHC2 zinc finger domain-containing protein [Thermoanaerobaculia bacterium]|nr:CHC2 zinc finger domain-containing protein [Thermoanaerobaculia bacterium]